MDYTLNNWAALSVYTDDGWLDIDNNEGETHTSPFNTLFVKILFGAKPGSAVSARAYEFRVLLGEGERVQPNFGLRIQRERRFVEKIGP